MSALAILIDCWDSEIADSGSAAYESTVDSIVHFCQTNHDISSLAMSAYSYRSMSQHGYSIQSWIENSNEWFEHTTKWDFLRQSWRAMQWNHANDVHSKIQHLPARADQIKFTALFDYHVLYYCNHICRGIKTIYFLGQSWQECVKFRPVGWLHIASLQYHNLLRSDIQLRTKSSCVYDITTKSQAQMQSPWFHLTEDIYQLDVNKIIW